MNNKKPTQFFFSQKISKIMCNNMFLSFYSNKEFKNLIHLMFQVQTNSTSINFNDTSQSKFDIPQKFLKYGYSALKMEKSAISKLHTSVVARLPSKDKINFFKKFPSISRSFCATPFQKLKKKH